jgi:hypothetical protein
MQTELFNTYLPSILLICITFATTHFKPFFFEAALTVNLTNMLVMTTILTSVMERLPSTAYVKHIDIWLVVGQLLPFAEVIILTIKEKLREGDGHGGAKPGDVGGPTQTINHHGKPRVVSLKQVEPIGDGEKNSREKTMAEKWIDILTAIGKLVHCTLRRSLPFGWILVGTNFLCTYECYGAENVCGDQEDVYVP